MSLLVVYEDMPSAYRAMQIAASLSDDADGFIQLETSPWRLDLITDTNWSDAIQENAETADLLIFSVSNPLEVTEVAVQWILAWMHRKSEIQGAFMIVTPSDHPFPHLDKIESTAKKRGIQIFKKQFNG